MLDDLRRPAGERAHARLQPLILPLDLDAAPTPGRALARQRQAALLRCVRLGPAENDGVEHDGGRAVVVKDNDAPAHADHVGGHADARLPVRGERVAQILRHGQIRRRRRLGRLHEKEAVGTDVPDHRRSSCP